MKVFADNIYVIFYNNSTIEFIATNKIPMDISSDGDSWNSILNEADIELVYYELNELDNSDTDLPSELSELLHWLSDNTLL
jgi:hypothetical protein